MCARQDAINAEALDLWRTLRNDPPPCGLYGSRLLSVLIEHTSAPSYDRLHSQHLRPSQIHRPR